MRLLRFGTEAVLAVVFGRSIVRALESEAFQIVVAAFLVVAVVGTAISAVVLWRGTRAKPAESY